MTAFLEGLKLFLGVVDKIFILFTKTPSEKIANAKEKLQLAINKRKKSGRP